MTLLRVAVQAKKLARPPASKIQKTLTATDQAGFKPTQRRFFGSAAGTFGLTVPHESLAR